MFETSIIPYEGRQAFEQFCDIMRSSKITAKEKNKYVVPPRRRKAWEIAVGDAEEAFAQNRQERKQQWTFTYITPEEKKQLEQETKTKDKKPVVNKDPKDKEETLPNGVVEKPPGKRKHQTVTGSDEGQGNSLEGSMVESPPKKRQKRVHSGSPAAVTGTEQGQGSSPSQSPLSPTLTGKEAAQFATFCKKRSDFIRREHPGYTGKQVEERLKGEWKDMDEEQKSKHAPAESEINTLSPGARSTSSEQEEGN